jgi:hypothetical protein
LLAWTPDQTGWCGLDSGHRVPSNRSCREIPSMMPSNSSADRKPSRDRACCGVVSCMAAAIADRHTNDNYRSCADLRTNDRQIRRHQPQSPRSGHIIRSFPYKRQTDTVAATPLTRDSAHNTKFCVLSASCQTPKRPKHPTRPTITHKLPPKPQFRIRTALSALTQKTNESSLRTN